MACDLSLFFWRIFLAELRHLVARWTVSIRQQIIASPRKVDGGMCCNPLLAPKGGSPYEPPVVSFQQSRTFFFLAARSHQHLVNTTSCCRCTVVLDELREAMDSFT